MDMPNAMPEEVKDQIEELSDATGTILLKPVEKPDWV